MRDLIDRQAAIAEFSCCELTPDGGIDANYAIDFLEQLPAAQPEPLTDKEQRIFLAAMSREEKVCKQVDDEYRDCKDSIVSICHEITRKVKGALWTILDGTEAETIEHNTHTDHRHTDPCP